MARGVGMSFTTSSMYRLYDRPGMEFVPIIDRPPSYTAVAWRPGPADDSGAPPGGAHARGSTPRLAR